MTGKKRFWASDACRHYAYRERVTSGNERVTSGFQAIESGNGAGSSGFFPHKKRMHQGDIRRGKIDPKSPGKLKKTFEVSFVIDLFEEYDTQRQETELYALINHKMLTEYIQKLLEDYNPGWAVQVEISKKSVTG